MTLGNKKRNIRIIFGFCIVALIAWLGIRIAEAFKSTAKAFEEDLPTTYTISRQDSNLIAPKYRNELKVVEVRRSKVRDDIAILSIGEQYTIILQRLKLSPSSPLTKAIHATEATMSRSTMVTYSIINLGDFSYQCKAGNVETATDLFLTLSGGAVKKLRQNDSLVSYSLRVRDMSLRYGEDSPVDIYMTIKEGFIRKAVPMNFMLLKKNNAVFFIVLSAKNGGELPKPDAIQEIVNVAA
jgi:hypothetical protein